MTDKIEPDELRRQNRNLSRLLAAQAIRLEGVIGLLSAISSLSAVPVKNTSLDDAARDILGTLVREVPDIDNCSLMLYSHETELLRLLAATGIADHWGENTGPFNTDLTFRPGQGIAGKVFMNNEPLFWNQEDSENERIELDDNLPSPQSLACLPLSALDRTIGVINISFSKQKAFDFLRQRELTLLGNVVANILQAFILKFEREREIAERQAVEQKLRTSLEEKEVLLREIHHRVKNNLQVISSLFYLQSGTVDDAKSLSILREAQTRVKTMALVHERLYQSEDLANIDMAEYIQRLMKYLFASFGTEQHRITMSLDVDPVMLSVDMAIPFGLIINELVSNAMTHAFGERTTGEISLGLKENDQGVISMMIGDNGLGLPEGLDLEHLSTLGLRIVNILVQQLDGEVEIERGNGTRFIIRLPRRVDREP